MTSLSPCRLPSPSRLSPFTCLLFWLLSCPPPSRPFLPFVPSLLLLISLPAPSLSLVLPVCPVSPCGLHARCSVTIFWEERVYACTPSWLWLNQGIFVMACFSLLAPPCISVQKGMNVARCLFLVPALASSLRGPSPARNEYIAPVEVLGLECLLWDVCSSTAGRSAPVWARPQIATAV